MKPTLLIRLFYMDGFSTMHIVLSSLVIELWINDQLQEFILNSSNFFGHIVNIIAQWRSYRFWQCERTFQLKVNIDVKQKVNFTNIS